MKAPWFGFRKVIRYNASLSDQVCFDWKSWKAEYQQSNIFDGETGLFFKGIPGQAMFFKFENWHGGKHSEKIITIEFFNKVATKYF